jgi:short-subunit dehydrogenase
VTTIAQDLSVAGAADALFRQLDVARIEPTIVVNNAGFGLHGAFARTSLERERAMIQLNVTTLTEITKLALERMLPRGSGRILNVASTAAFQAGPFMAVYAATKAFVLSLTEAIANETRGSGVTVTALCPGPTATGFARRAEVSGARLFKSGVQDAESVARRAYAGLMGGERLVIPGFRNKLLVQSLRVSPRASVIEIVRRMQE